MWISSHSFSLICSPLKHHWRPGRKPQFMLPVLHTSSLSKGAQVDQRCLGARALSFTFSGGRPSSHSIRPYTTPFWIMKTKSPIPSSPETQRGFPIEGHVQGECYGRHRQRPLGRTSLVCWYSGDRAEGRWCKRNHGLYRIRSKLMSYKIPPILSPIPTRKTGHLPASLRRPSTSSLDPRPVPEWNGSWEGLQKPLLDPRSRGEEARGDGHCQTLTTHLRKAVVRSHRKWKKEQE